MSFSEVEGSFTLDNQDLYTKFWLPSETAKAKLVFIHGFSDHINAYLDMFPKLATRGIAVYAFDQRGWGRSVKKPADKGASGPTSQVIRDIVEFIRRKAQPAEPIAAPLFVLGHSMGGGEVLTLASDPAYADVVDRVHGWLLESPLIDMPEAVAPSSIEVFAGRLAARIMPRFHLVKAIPLDKITRNVEVQKMLAEDPLCHDTGTLEGFAGMLDRMIALRDGTVHLLPSVQRLWLAHGSNDAVTCYAASKKWFEREAEGRRDTLFQSYEDCLHQLHTDDCKDTFVQDVGDWILQRIDTLPVENTNSNSTTDESTPAPKL